MKRENVLVVLVDYNTADLVPGVLESIKEDFVDVSVLIVDNGPSDESYQQLKRINDPRVHVIKSNENLGFAGGNNYGIRYAMENLPEFKYVFLLNTDAYLTPNLIGGLKQILDENNDAACVSPKIFAKEGRIWYGGANFDFKKGHISSFIEIDANNPQSFYEVDLFNGCAVLFRLDRYLEAGMLNENLFMYYEEADFSLKLRKLGYKIFYSPLFTVLHDVSYSTRNISHLKTYYVTRNKFGFFSGTMTLQSKLYYLMHEFAFFLKRRKYKNALYLVKGYIDYRKGKTGRLKQSA